MIVPGQIRIQDPCILAAKMSFDCFAQPSGLWNLGLAVGKDALLAT
jgi:hypothetical protein